MAIVTPFGEACPLIGGFNRRRTSGRWLQMADVEDARTPVARLSARRREVPGVMQSLARQARLIALACLLVDVVMFAVATPDLPGALRIGGLITIVCVDAALALPPRYSGQVAVAHAATAVGLALLLQATPGADWDLIGSVIAAYRTGAWLRDRSSIGAVIVLAAGIAIAESVAGPGDMLAAVTGVVKDAFIPWLVGRYTSARRGYIAELHHNREMEVRDATAEMERAAERLRTSIARDLHDVISHHVSAIGVHAGAARLKLAARPEFADPDIIDSLTAVEASSRSAMLDLRRVLDILHRTSDSTSQIGLGNLDELFDGVRRSGLAIRFQVTGMPRELPGSVDIALYRIAQEMLTNALRYGDGTTVDVDLDFGENHVVLSVRNGIGPRQERADRPSTGRGLVGIRSRVALFGGTVSHGPDGSGKTWETRVNVCFDASSSGEAL
ncbi:sensor histidine kinase [Nonomuraea sp. ZG12]|uniref:sensor histidine kinase n=1 Tax=Nonomuraea sp. ZG12 TaxID=3452207 RepID=UPI003F8BEAAA